MTIFRFVGLVGVLWCGVVWGQAKGVIEGSVTERGGGSLPGANIAIEGPPLPEGGGTIAGSDGFFRLEGIPVGLYTVAVTFIGYKAEVRREVQVVAGRATRLEITLDSQIIFLDQNVVSASRRQEKVLEAPASVAVVESGEIRANPVLTVSEHIKDLPAVDFAQTGLVQSNVVVRGFNNIFSGALLTLTDNRLARVPSLRLNAYNFIPVTNDDVERIELVLGPGSALYGPNSANGVMHIITHSPFTSQGTSVDVGLGERSLRKTAVRHAGVVGERLGYKVSAQYYTGTDWKYSDPEETRGRDFDIERRSAEVRLDYRAAEDLTAIASAGYNVGDHIELTGLGAGQVRDWAYNYAQLRLLYRDWFFQAFHNWSDAGDTFLLRSGDPIVDKSSMTVLQAQHTADLGPRQRFTYGFDALWTRPDTDGTITGKNEDDDDINEYGGYLQSETALSDQLDLVLALRYDEHNRLEDPEISPRAALVYKPRQTQSVRLTYNRAFSTPTTNNLYLDLVSRQDAFGLGPSFTPLFQGLGLEFRPFDVRAQGTYSSSSDEGFTFRRNQGRPLFRSPFTPLVAGQLAQLGLSPGDAGYAIGADGYMALDDPLVTNVMWGLGRGAVLQGFVPQFQDLTTAGLMAQGMGAEDAQTTAGQLAAALPGIVPEQLTDLHNILGTLNLETAGFDFVADNGGPVEAVDVPRSISTITQTIELGYKGVIGNKLVVAADFHQTKTEDFGGPLAVETPNVFLEPQSLGAALGPAIGQALADPANEGLAQALATLDQVQVEGVVQGNNNGSAVDELVALFVGGAARIPYGTVSPEQASDPHAVLLTYRNFGDVTIEGLDLSLAYYPDDNWTVTGNYSYVRDNFFENLSGIADVALNAAKNKVKVGAAYNFADLGLEIGGRLRYSDSFRLNSGVYVGEVDAYTVVDLNVTYQLPVEQDLVLRLDGSNVLDNTHQEFVGAPEIGRLIFGQVGVRF